MRSIDRKLLRDLRHLKGQIITVAFVVAAGLAGLVGMISTLWSIESSMNAYYERQRFGEIFARAVRAPNTLAPRLEEISGVQSVYTRVVEGVRVPMPGLVEPAMGTVVSIPADRQPPLNALFIVEGRYLEPGQPDEILILDAFATAHDLAPGDTVDVVLEGSLRRLTIVGTAMSPEFVFVAPPGEFFPEDETITVIWMAHAEVEAAFQMSGAFNDVVLALQPRASQAAVLEALDNLLEPYGGPGAISRENHPSHSLVANEQDQLQALGLTIPVGFLFIAAFLLNVVLSRVVQLQRPEIATLKAVGYGNTEIAAHFFKFVLVILAIGSVLGTFFGAWIGRGMISIYADFFRFPGFAFALSWRLVFIGVLVSLTAGVAGAFGALYRVARLAPAEAMSPPAPTVYRRSVLERLGLERLLSGPVRMIVRELERHPLRFGFSMAGLALGVGLLVLGRFGLDAIDRLLEIQFEIAGRDDVSVVLTHPMPQRAARSLLALPGVQAVETQRVVPVRFEFEHRQRDSVIIGYDESRDLLRVVDSEGQIVDLPETGLVLSSILAARLGVEVGDVITAHVQEGHRQMLRIPVTGVVDDIAGLQGYMSIAALWEAMGEPPTVTSAYLRIDHDELETIFARLDEMPAVISSQDKRRTRQSVQERLDEGFGFQTIIIVLVASAMTIGVVYNNARVALSTRGRDLASLRVLGFTRGEVGFILLGEQALQVLLAIPLGWILGAWFAALLIATTDPEVFRFPVVISAQTYAFATVVTVVSAVVSGLLVRRRLNQMDLTEVLKTRE